MKYLLLSVCAAGLAVGAIHAQARAETHPDLTGVWSTPFRMHSSGLPLQAGATPWMPASMDVHSYRILGLDELSTIADKSVIEHKGVPIFGGPKPPELPFTPAGAAARAAMTPEIVERRPLNCLPSNVVDRVPGSPLQIVQGSRAIALMTEGGTPGRTVFMDRRNQDDAIPQWNGYSVGHWKGDTLEVRTVAIRGDGFGFPNRLPLDDKAILTEDYTLQPDRKTLDVLVTLQDPTLYAEPIHKLVHLSRADDVLVTDYTCTEGKDDMVEMQVKPGALPAG